MNFSSDNSSCPNGFKPLVSEMNPIWIHHAAASFAYLITIFNILVICMFMKCKILTPATIILMCLAVTDTLAAITQSLPWHFGLLFGLILPTLDLHYSLVGETFCGFFTIVQGPLFYTFNDASILLTTFLGVIKAMAIRFPLYFRTSFNIKLTISIVFMCFAAAAAIELYPVFSFAFYTDDNGMCCQNDVILRYFNQYSVVGQWILPIVFIVSFVCLGCSTSYIIGKLLCCKTKSGAIKISHVVRNRHRKIGISVVSITVVFILSESLDLIHVLSPLTTFVFGLQDVYEFPIFRNAFQYQRLIQEIGYASNFVIYLITSEELRGNLFKMVSCRCSQMLRRRPQRASGSASMFVWTMPETLTKYSRSSVGSEHD